MIITMIGRHTSKSSKAVEGNCVKNIDDLVEAAGSADVKADVKLGVATAEACAISAKMMRDMRVLAGLTQAQVADALTTKQSRIAYLESGRSVQGPTIGTLYKVAAVCGIEIKLGFHKISEGNNGDEKGQCDQSDHIPRRRKSGQGDHSKHHYPELVSMEPTKKIA